MYFIVCNRHILNVYSTQTWKPTLEPSRVHEDSPYICVVTDAKMDHTHTHTPLMWTDGWLMGVLLYNIVAGVVGILILFHISFSVHLCVYCHIL